MNIKRFKRIKYRRLFIAIFLTILFIVSIPTLVIGANNDIGVLLVLGIVFVVVGFYGIIAGFLLFGLFNMLESTLIAIEVDKIYLLEDISKHINKNVNEVKNNISTLINKRCLVGYTIDEYGNIIANTMQNIRVNIGSCNNCSGPLEEENGIIKCPYCGTIVTKN